MWGAGLGRMALSCREGSGSWKLGKSESVRLLPPPPPGLRHLLSFSDRLQSSGASPALLLGYIKQK